MNFLRVQRPIEGARKKYIKGTSSVPCLRKRTGKGFQEKVIVALLKETEGRESRDKGHGPMCHQQKTGSVK